MNRRGFIQACLAAATAPYVVTTAGVLMPVKKIVTYPANWERALKFEHAMSYDKYHLTWVTEDMVKRFESAGYTKVTWWMPGPTPSEFANKKLTLMRGSSGQ